jgi:hypothetical protein
MVDGELWCRFFELDQLWHLRAVLGGYRCHGANRAQVRYREVEAEMRRAVAELRSRAPAQMLRTAARLGRIRNVSRWMAAAHLPLDDSGCSARSSGPFSEKQLTARSCGT